MGVVSVEISSRAAISFDGAEFVCMKNSGTSWRILHLIVMPVGVDMSQPFCLSCTCLMSFSRTSLPNESIVSVFARARALIDMLRSSIWSSTSSSIVIRPLAVRRAIGLRLVREAFSS